MDDKLTEKPMVSILMLAYNHGKYIRQALDGILMQKVDFTYEIVVGEDCSQDNTRDILLEYQERYPDRIKLILHEKNVGMKENSNAVRKQCKGKYMASCEGDDYWVDSYKLKKQVEFLENHPEYVGTAHKIEIVDEYSKPRKDYEVSFYCEEEIYTIKHVEKGILPGQTATLVYRNILADDSSAMRVYGECGANGDMKIALFLALHGNVYCFNEVMSHYRYIPDHGDSWSAKTAGKNLNLFYFNQFRELSLMAKRLKNVEVNYTKPYLDCGLSAFGTFLRKPTHDNFKIMKEIYREYNDKTAMSLYILKNFWGKAVNFLFRRVKKYNLKPNN